MTMRSRPHLRIRAPLLRCLLAAAICILSLAPSAEAARVPRKWKFGIELLPTMTEYSEVYEFQPGLPVPRMVQKSLNGKGSLTFFIIANMIDVNFEALGTLYIHETQFVSQRMKSYELNGRLGVVLPSESEHWRTVIFGGWYHANTKVAGNAYGYRNLYGPQLYPQFEYGSYIEDRQLTFGFFGKYSPITDGVTGYSLSNYSTSAGLSLRIPVGKLVYPVHAYTTLLSFNFSWSKLHYEYAPGTLRSTRIDHETLSAGLGLAF